MPIAFSPGPPVEGIDGGDPSSCNFGAGGLFAIMCWFKTSVRDGTMFCKGGDGGGGIRIQLAIDQNNGKVRFTCDDNASKDEVLSNAVLDNGVWHHVAGRRTSTTLLEMFVNGVKQTDTQAISAGRDYDSTNPLVIGAIEDAGSGNLQDGLDGDVDDCRFYGGAPSDDRILNIYTARGHDMDVEDLRARFQLGEGTAGSVPASGDVKDSGPFSIVTTTIQSPVYSDGELTYKRRCVG